MKLQKRNKTIEVEVDRPFYLVLNGHVVAATKSVWGIDNATMRVLRVLTIIHCPYDKTINLYVDEDGIRHQVTEITAL